jgi:hypothetical protein
VLARCHPDVEDPDEIGGIGEIGGTLTGILIKTTFQKARDIDD